MARCSLLAAGSALWHSLLYISKLHADRAELRDDSRLRVDLRITGTVSGISIAETVAGWLTVSPPQTKASSSAVPTAQLVAYLLAQVPATRRADAQAQAAAYFAEHGSLPGVIPQEEDAAKLWLKQLRSTHPKTVEGAVTFDADPDPVDLAAAERRAAA